MGLILEDNFFEFVHRLFHNRNQNMYNARELLYLCWGTWNKRTRDAAKQPTQHDMKFKLLGFVLFYYFFWWGGGGWLGTNALAAPEFHSNI